MRVRGSRAPHRRSSAPSRKKQVEFFFLSPSNTQEYRASHYWRKSFSRLFSPEEEGCETTTNGEIFVTPLPPLDWSCLVEVCSGESFVPQTLYLECKKTSSFSLAFFCLLTTDPNYLTDTTFPNTFWVLLQWSGACQGKCWIWIPKSNNERSFCLVGTTFFWEECVLDKANPILYPTMAYQLIVRGGVGWMDPTLGFLPQTPLSGDHFFYFLSVFTCCG